MKRNQGMRYGETHSHRGGGNKVLHDRVPETGYPEHDRDVFLAQQAFAKVDKAMRAAAINGDKVQARKKAGIRKWAKDICRYLAGNPFLQLTEKQRSSLMKTLGMTELPPLNGVGEDHLPPSLRDLPKRPPQAPKKDEEE